jgi:putative transposase
LLSATAVACPRRAQGLFLSVLEQVRKQYEFVIFGYVVMPEHFHLLISEPKSKNLSTVMQVLKQRVSRHMRQRSSRPDSSRQTHLVSTASDDVRFWQLRFHDFNAFTRHKFVEKLRYIHRNPVERGLVSQPDQWPWSSFRFYAYGEKSVVQVDYDLPDSEPQPVFSKRQT